MDLLTFFEKNSRSRLREKINFFDFFFRAGSTQNRELRRFRTSLGCFIFFGGVDGGPKFFRNFSYSEPRYRLEKLVSENRNYIEEELGPE